MDDLAAILHVILGSFLVFVAHLLFEEGSFLTVLVVAAAFFGHGLKVQRAESLVVQYLAEQME